jgi:hypothetical protein
MEPRTTPSLSSYPIRQMVLQRLTYKAYPDPVAAARGGHSVAASATGPAGAVTAPAVSTPRSDLPAALLDQPAVARGYQGVAAAHLGERPPP